MLFRLSLSLPGTWHNVVARWQLTGSRGLIESIPSLPSLQVSHETQMLIIRLTEEAEEVFP